MCSRYNLRTDPKKLTEAFALFRAPEFRPLFNIKISHRVPVVKAAPEGREAVLMRWGLIANWYKEPRSPRGEMFNARAETVHERTLWRNLFRDRRCIVPATGFYEWRTEGKTKTPFRIGWPGDGIAGFAGLWERWEPKQEGQGEAFESFAIVTTSNPPALAAIPHERCPLILHPKDYDLWLDPKVGSRKELDPLLRPWDRELIVEPETEGWTKRSD
jgi:putative SOS response-associated peptidase YedK